MTIPSGFDLYAERGRVSDPVSKLRICTFVFRVCLHLLRLSTILQKRYVRRSYRNEISGHGKKNRPHETLEALDNEESMAQEIMLRSPVISAYIKQRIHQ